ncbi:MAG TPA: TolC family protein, partial [Acidobacteriaceae bacterium]|nr:TolC family protein [Acidobacteriaceae bacterium]
MTLKVQSALRLALLLLTPSLFAQTTPPSVAPLTMQQAVERARLGNPALIAARQHVSAVRAAEITAGLRQNPNLTLLGQGVTLPDINPIGNPYYYSAGVSRVFERGQKRRWRLESATATTDVTESQLHDQERQVVLSVRQAFTNLLAAKAALAVAEENLTDYRKTVDLSKARLDAGDITRTDFERIDLQLAQFESDADSARLNVQQASAQLQLLFGVDRPAKTLDIVGTLDLPVIPLTMDEAEAKALAARPDYLAAQQSVRLAQANAKFAIAGGTVDPTLASEYERSGIDNTFGVSISIPLRI